MKSTSCLREWKAQCAGALTCVFLALALCMGYAQATSDETRLLKDIRPGKGDSGPEWLTEVEGTVFFGAVDDDHGWELWKSDGTEAGTILVKDICPGPTGSRLHRLTAVNVTLFIAADDCEHGKELWKSDGTAQGTVMVKDISQTDSAFIDTLRELVGLDDMLLFTAWEYLDSGRYELWKSDGTPNGTSIVKHSWPDGSSGIPIRLTAVDDTLFFVSQAGREAAELWKSDGSDAGTVLVKDIFPGGASWPDHLVAVDGMLYFWADDGVHGCELWKSDGTEAGTTMVRDITPGTGGSCWPAPQALGVDSTYFFGFPGGKLYKSDGTEAGTVLIKDINPGSTDSQFAHPFAVNGTLFFWADDGIHGAELWKSDGTVDGTALVRDIYAGLRSGYPDLYPYLDPTANRMVEANGILFFPAQDESHGTELWMSDGTEAGTVLVRDVNPGDGSSYVGFLTRAINRLIFRAGDEASGHELWTLEGVGFSTYAPLIGLAGYREVAPKTE